MPKTLPRLGGPAIDFASAPSTSNGVTSTAHATINTKAASFTTLIATTTHDTAWLSIQIYTATASSLCLTDIAVGAAASEIVIIPNLPCNTQVNAGFLVATYLFPVNIPAGSRISCRTQASVTVASLRVAVQCIAPGKNGYSGAGRVEAGGPTTAGSSLTVIDPGATANTEGAWVELLAASTFDYRWLVAVATFDAQAAATTCTWLLDIGVGAAAAEQVLINDLFCSIGSAGDVMMQEFHLPLSVLSGSRIAARCRCSLNTATVRLLDAAIWGCG